MRSQRRSGEIKCEDCIQGSYAPSTEATSCQVRFCDVSLVTCCQQLCPVGSYSNANRSFACTPCSAGSYSASGSHLGSTGCLPCQPGRFADSQSQSSCDLCTKGYFMPNS